jgi:hypothetical protein
MAALVGASPPAVAPAAIPSSTLACTSCGGDGAGACVGGYHVYADEPSSETGGVGATDMATHVVNLDAPPGERWAHILPRYAADARVLLGLTAREVARRDPAFVHAVAALAASLEARFDFAAELRGIAALLDVDLPTLLAAQLWLELYGACSTAVVELDARDAGGGGGGDAAAGPVPFLLRTMDWNFEEAVFSPDGGVSVTSFQREAERATFQAKFARGGRVLYIATMHAGAVGFITGAAPGRFGVSINFRLGEFHAPLEVRRAESLARVGRGDAPVALVVRDLLERAGAAPTYADALAAARDVPLMSGCYVSLVGPGRGQGVIVTRAKTRAAEELPLWRLDGDGPTVQTNDDIFVEDDGWTRTGVAGAPWARDASGGAARGKHSCGRRNLTEATLARWRSGGCAPLTRAALWALMSVPPVRNSTTVFTTAMCVATGHYASAVGLAPAAAAAAELFVKGSADAAAAPAAPPARALCRAACGFFEADGGGGLCSACGRAAAREGAR